MLRYFYAYTPFIIVGTVFLLALPWLGLIALMVFALVALAALAALAWAIIAAPYFLVRSLGRRWQERSGADQPRPALSLVERRTA
jgi:membrane protein implicated in regulation of membrane protease activity